MLRCPASHADDTAPDGFATLASRFPLCQTRGARQVADHVNEFAAVLSCRAPRCPNRRPRDARLRVARPARSARSSSTTWRARERCLPFLGRGRLRPRGDRRAGEPRAAASRAPARAVAEALVRQQEARERRERGERARGPGRARGAVAIVTGQQAGLFGGPLFVLLKAARDDRGRRAGSRRSAGRPVVPVFWVASDDHDFAEIRSTSVIDDAGRAAHACATRRSASRSASRPRAIVLDDTHHRPRRRAGARPARRPSSRDDGLRGASRSATRPGETLSGAFARLVSRLLPELVVLDPADPALKALAAPVLARELREALARRRASPSRRASGCSAAGYHQQVPVRPGFLNLFVVVDGQRRALALRERRRRDPRHARADVRSRTPLRRLERDPAPGARARSCARSSQDCAAADRAPTWAGRPRSRTTRRSCPSYAHFGIPRPRSCPGPSVDPRRAAAGARARRRAAHASSTSSGDPEALVARWAREAYPEVEAAFARAREAIEREMGGGRGGARARSTRRCAPPPTRPGAARCTRSRGSTRRRCARSRSATRGARTACGARATRCCPAARCRSAASGSSALLGPPRRGARRRCSRERLDPFARGHQVIRL